MTRKCYKLSPAIYLKKQIEALPGSHNHEQLGHEVLNINSDGAGLTKSEHRATLELFQSDIAPALRRAIPSRPFLPAAA